MWIGPAFAVKRATQTAGKAYEEKRKGLPATENNLLRVDQQEQEIDDIRKSLVVLESLWREIKISITPKFHMICIHVKQYCQITGKSLQMNEQSLESSHSKFIRLVQRYAGSNPDTENPLYALNILRAFEVFDSNAAFRDSL